MKRSQFVFAFLFLIYSTAFTQESPLLDVKVQTLGEINVSIGDIIKKNETPVILFTYSQDWCEICVSSLDIFQDHYKDYTSEYKIIAINIDDNRTSQNIKEFVVKKGWTFDVYMDPERNIIKYLGSDVRAPDAFVLIDKREILYKRGYVDQNAQSTVDNLVLSILYLSERLILFDSNWNYTDKNTFEYFRTVDIENNLFYVQDRWKAGELQMKGYYTDKYLTERTGPFIWYHKNGKYQMEKVYKDNVVTHEKIWYDTGNLWTERSYVDGKLHNVIGLYDSNGKLLNHGTLKDGNGSLLIYNPAGSKVEKQTYINGLATEWIYYNDNGGVRVTYIWKDNKWVEK